MKSAADYLLAGFDSASRRPHYVILDLIGKGLFWGIAAIVFWLAFAWFVSRIDPSDSQLAAIRSGIPPLAIAAVAEAVLNNLPRLGPVWLWAAFSCLALWTAMEAFIRGGLLPLTENSIIRDAAVHFPLYFMSGALRRLTLVLAATLAGLVTLGPLLSAPVAEWGSRWPEVQWPAVAGVVLVALLALFLTILDTLARCEAWDLLASSLPEILLVVALPSLLEASMWNLGVAVSTLAIRASLAPGTVLGIMVVSIVGLGALHSYLLLARYSAVAIMQRDWNPGTVGLPGNALIESPPARDS